MTFPQQYVSLVDSTGGSISNTISGAVNTESVGSSGGSIAGVQALAAVSSTAITSSGTTTNGPFTNPGFSGALLHLNLSSVSNSAAASPTLDITVQGQDPATSSYYNLPGASFTQITTSTSEESLVIHPSIPNDSGTGFRRRPGPLPNNWRLSVSAQSLDSGSTGATYEYTVGVTYIP